MDARAPIQGRSHIGRFTCNICGATNDSLADTEDRELATCTACKSNIRFRAIALVLSRALFGLDLPLCDFPVLKSMRGLGISDSDIYSRRLEEHFSYLNTFYHREPFFDLSHPDPTEFEKYDFVICSEVLEHVPPPVDRAFDTLARLLKPKGMLILTVPYTLGSATVEHFERLRDSGLASITGKPVLVSRSADGGYEVFDDLAFHGGQGSTLEMRIFSEADVRAKLVEAGLTHVSFETMGSREFGVEFSGPSSLPVLARRGPFALGSSGITELVKQLRDSRSLLRAAGESRWMKLGRLLGVGPVLGLEK